MLLKKIVIIIAILFMLLLPVSYAQVCEVEKIKQALRKALYLHFIEEVGSGLTPNEVKDILIFYLTISAQNSTVDCSALGINSNKPLFDVIGIGENLLDRIPACAEGTKYGECSKIRPSYCYAGAIYEKCGLCGCPTNSVCGKSGKCETLTQNITCFRDIDCGQSAFVGDYFCSNNYIAKNYVNYTCISPGTVNSKCMQANGTTILNYCNPNLNQICAAGQSTCKLTINDSAPTVAISVSPTTTTKGQFFNVTVTGTDDIGLSMIWWWGVNTADAELNKAYLFGCSGAKTCKNSWLVSTNATGVLTLGADSRDTAYPVAGQPHQASEGQGIAYATVTITEPGATAVSGLTIKGRLIDRFTLKPVPNIAIFSSTTGLALNPIYTNANGEFSVSTLTNITSAKMFPYWPKCYHQGFFLLEKKFDGSLNVRLYLFDLIKEDKSFAVTGSEVNLGDIPLWPAVDISISSDIAVQMNIEYPEEGRSYGNINYKTSHYSSNIVPLAYNTRVQLKDQSGNIYYSPYKTYGLENGCAPVTLTFSSKQFIWSGAAQTNVSNISSCFVKIDGIVVKSVYATDRNDCYSKTSFGSENCKTYAPYFTDGVHFLEQYFGTTDRVNNEYCTCTNGVCVQGNQTAQNVTLHSLAVNGSNLEAVYSKNFDTCVHLLTSTSTITHTQNYFCTQGNYIKTTAPLSGFTVNTGQNYKLCHGNNYNVCSGLVALTNVMTTNQTTLQAPSNIIAGWGITNDNTKKSSLYFHAINFAYTDPVPTAFRVYLKKPGESAFNRAAEFRNLSAPCETITTTGSILSTGWSIYRRCNSNNWKIDSYWLPTTGYPQGVYRFYLTAADSSGIERASPEFEMYNLQPLTVSSPTSAQSPVASKPTLQWTVASGWPKSPIPYSVQIFDDAKFGDPWIVHSTGVNVPTSSTTASYVYDGPALDPAKKYVVRMYGLSRAYPTGLCPSCDYISMDTSTQTFWVSGNQTQPDSCLDSDNGIYTYTKGFAAGYQKGVLVNLSDYCAGSTNYIYEAYCGTNITYQLVACSYQCSNGACVNQSTTTTNQNNLSVTLIVPNGGEKLQTGDKFLIQWKHPLTPDFSGSQNMGWSIGLYIPGNGGWDIAGKALPINQSSYQWTIPSYLLPDSSNYYARISLVKNCIYAGVPCPEPVQILPDGPSDDSDKAFSIMAAPSTTPVSGLCNFVDFEDDPQVGGNIVYNPDYGSTPGSVAAHRAWLNSKGIDITGTPNGFVWSSKISGNLGSTGVVIGFASPDFLSDYGGLSDTEALNVILLNSSAKSVEVKVTAIPSSTQSVNNVPATVVINALDSAGSMVASTTQTFTSVTNGVYTPQKINISSTASNIAKIKLSTTQHPYSGLYIEELTSCK